LRVLYVASAIEAGGTSGGFTHVTEVACGLKSLGHTLLVITRPDPEVETPRHLECGVPLRTVRPRKEVALTAVRQLSRAIRQFRPDVVMERFYNFAGAGVMLAHRAGLPVLLEVNAPMTDPPGSLKTRIDRALLGSMRRWAVRQALWSDAIVTPLHTTVPPEVPRSRIHELPWGANVEQFDPIIRQTRRAEIEALAAELGLSREGPVAVFLGSFRAWHGVRHFAEAARMLLERGTNLSFLAVGGGPELEPLREQANSWNVPPERFVFAGPQHHDRVPLLLSVADIGVAPFDLSAHAPLQTFGFYWSPLKVFEYMSMSLPIVTVDVPPLNEIVRNGEEGVLYPSGNVTALADALESLASDPGQRDRMGRSARERVVERYSWQAHCVALDGILREIAHAR
jgi:alpha-maltose-1-phosphate synthase